MYNNFLWFSDRIQLGPAKHQCMYAITSASDDNTIDQFKMRENKRKRGNGTCWTTGELVLGEAENGQ